MAICPLCSERVGKRFCPAKAFLICAVCCGTKREVEIDCPSSCSYLKSSRDYESEKRIPDAGLAEKVRRFDDGFVHHYSPVFNVIGATILEERLGSSWLVDSDVIEVYKALAATMRTLSSGIYYESLPGGPVRMSLFRRLKALLDELMKPDPQVDRRTLKVSEVVDVLDFLTFAAESHSSIRPKSRRYLDWLGEMSGFTPPAQQSGLILP